MQQGLRGIEVPNRLKPRRSHHRCTLAALAWLRWLRPLNTIHRAISTPSAQPCSLSLGTGGSRLNRRTAAERVGLGDMRMMNEIRARIIAAKVIEEFGRLLSRMEIKIPSSERRIPGDHRCLIGREYSELHDALTAIVLKGMRSSCGRSRRWIQKHRGRRWENAAA